MSTALGSVFQTIINPMADAGRIPEGIVQGMLQATLRTILQALGVDAEEVVGDEAWEVEEEEEIEEGGPGSGWFAPPKGTHVGGEGEFPRIQKGPTAFLVRIELEEAKLPSLHLDQIEEIQFTQGEYVGGDAYGTYQPANGIIKLAANPPGEKGGNISVYGGATILHEIGHHVHLAKLNDEAAQEWFLISKGGEAARISSYARTGVGEHFAECYRAYARGGDHRKRLRNLEPNSYKFMRLIWGTRGEKKFLPVGELKEESAQWERYHGRTS